MAFDFVIKTYRHCYSDVLPQGLEEDNRVQKAINLTSLVVDLARR